MDLVSILPVLGAFFIVTVSPGPANIAVATIAMSSGRYNGLRFGAGLAAGLGFWGIVAATGMGAVLQASEYALIALKVFGGVYLLWLAFQSGKSAIFKDSFSESRQSQGRWFVRGLLLNLSNPKAVVAWMAALSVGLGAGDQYSELFFVTLCCMVLGLLNYTVHALAFSLPSFMNGYRRFSRWINGLVSALFATAGFGLLRSAWKESFEKTAI